MTHILVRLAALLLALPALAAPASVRVVADGPVAVGTLADGSLINTNRDYAFEAVPPELAGLACLRHAHKEPVPLQIEVTQAGTVWLLLGEWDGDPPAIGVPLQPAGELRGGDGGGAKRTWRVWRADLAAGDRLSVPRVNKWGAVLAAGAIDLRTPPPSPTKLADEEWQRLENELSLRPKGETLERLRRETLRPDALLADGDRDPLDVALRRTRALLDHLRGMANAPDLSAEAAAVDELATRAQDADRDGRRAIFAELLPLRRRIAFSNPLLDFDRIVFLTHHRSKTGNGANHMCDQYFGFNAHPGGGLYVLEDAFGDSPRAVDLLKGRTVAGGRLAGRELTGGSFTGLELSYDARRLWFAFTEAQGEWSTWTPESCYHVFATDLDGGPITQLTDGATNDFDPCLLPSGELAFVSERRGGFGRCHGRPVPTYTLHAMNPDGTGIRRLSHHETNEWHPSVDHDGLIVYTRWDYVDRDSDVAHHLWTCFPDGRDPRSLHGNYPEQREMRPWMELSLRAVPGSRRYVGVAAPHHGQAYGSLILVDPRRPDDAAMSQVKRITPDVALPEAEKRPGEATQPGDNARGGEVFGSPWPLSEDFHLCVYDPGGKRYGLYLIDSFGNRELLWRDAAVPCLDPIPLRPRPTPPALASPLPEAAEPTGTVAVMNVYDSELPWPDGTTITALRIVQIFPKTTPNADQPRIGFAAQSLARGVIGTVPVESDGSAHFTVPAGVPIYFQALDENGLAVQTMRSDTYLHPGERLTCVGCHEPKRRAPAAGGPAPLALQRPPSSPQPEADGAYPVSFARLVQPVLDRHCVDCHSRAKAPSLRGDRFGEHGWSEAYHTLRRHAWGKAGGNGAIVRNGGSRSIPGQVGAHASRLHTMLSAGHRNVTLRPDELRRITLWLDTNSVFYGAYEEPEKQARGGVVVPSVE